MKLIFLCKRRPMGRDLVEQPYGRFFHLPRLLARAGHDVHLALLSYRRDPPLDLHRDGIHWISESIGIDGGLRFYARVRRLIESESPDWIIGFSDTYYGILATHFATAFGTKSLVDAYDNYEGYIPWCKPLHYLWRRSLGRATAISAAGPALAEIMTQGNVERALIAPMAPDPHGFEPMPRLECRSRLNLPPAGTLVGYFGAVYPNRGVEVLFEAMDLLRRTVPDARLVVSGRVHPSIQLPGDAIWMGYVPDEQMPLLMNSVDALAVVNRPSAFGLYSHPIKLYEAMACGVPVAASRTPATEWILASQPHLLVEPGDPVALARTLEVALRHERVDYGRRDTWETVAERLEHFLGSHDAGDVREAVRAG